MRYSKALGFGVLACVLTSTVQAMDEEAYDAWIETRLGPADGSPIYWWGSGLVSDAETGEPLYIFEYYDTTHQITHPDYPNKQIGLTRKFDAFRDKDTHEILKTFEGREMKTLLYPYQMLEYELVDGKVLSAVTQGSGKHLRTHRSEGGIYTKRVGDFWHFEVHAQFSVARPEYPGTRDTAAGNWLFITRADDTTTTPIHHWAVTSVGWRESIDGSAQTEPRRLRLTHYDGGGFADYEELPQHVREFIEAELPAWKEPPRDIEEVREIQSAGKGAMP